MIRNPRFHGRSHAEGRVNATEVVVRVPENHSGPMVLELFAEGVRQSRKPTKPHAKA